MRAANGNEAGSRQPTAGPAPSQGMRRTTGRDRHEWFRALDAWGAGRRGYGEIAAWLVAEHGLSQWWAQKLTVEYEQARGTREPGARRGGTFAMTTSKTVPVPVARLYQAFVDADLRERWLPDVVMSERTSRPGRSARFDWDDGRGTRVNVAFTKRGEHRSQVVVEHERLPDAEARDEARAFWRDRLTVLEALLED